jgi:hypothetical protein
MGKYSLCPPIKETLARPCFRFILRTRCKQDYTIHRHSLLRQYSRNIVVLIVVAGLATYTERRPHKQTMASTTRILREVSPASTLPPWTTADNLLLSLLAPGTPAGARQSQRGPWPVPDLGAAQRQSQCPLDSKDHLQKYSGPARLRRSLISLSRAALLTCWRRLAYITQKGLVRRVEARVPMSQRANDTGDPSWPISVTCFHADPFANSCVSVRGRNINSICCFARAISARHACIPCLLKTSWFELYLSI